jgi:hypothetical protein
MSGSDIVQSVSNDQSEILKSIIDLHCPNGIDADITYGNGVFYRSLPSPALKFDIDPQQEGVIEASSTSLPIADSAIGAVVFDPPFLTYVRAGREGNGRMIMSGRFSGYWRYDELEAHYRDTLRECKRILKKDGIMIFKCQDIIHNHRMHCTHANVIQWASEVGMRLKDLFVLVASHRLPAPNRNGKQRHARIFHSYFLVLQS